MLFDIEHIKDHRKSTIEYLSTSNIPLLLYGAGVYASHIKSFLERNNIKIDYVVLDKDFYKQNIYFENIPIQFIDEVLAENIAVNVIFAFGEYRKKMIDLSSHKHVVKCIFLDGFQHQQNFNVDYVEKHYTEFEKLYNKLEDDHSKQVMIAFIESILSACSDKLYDLNIKNEEQYFPVFIQLSSCETFVDCGAFDGDTIITFSKLTNTKYKKIYAFECDKKNVEKLRINISALNNIEIIEQGCYSEKKILSFSNTGSMVSKIENDGMGFQIETNTIDNIVLDNDVSFIKMDIEGVELEALKGAKNTIVTNRPKLAIAVYHRPEDLITIPQYILSLNNNYKIFLRHYTDNLEETILYAIDDFSDKRIE